MPVRKSCSTGLRPVRVLTSTIKHAVSLAFVVTAYSIAASVSGIATNVHQLRDPAIYEEGGRTWLVYSVAGESGLGLAELNV